MQTPQQPIGSGFGPATTAEKVIAGHDLSGKVAIVTGGGSGLGLETVRRLAGAGAQVVVPARTMVKARDALAGVAGVEIAPLELGDRASIEAFAAAFLASGRPLHMLINSAGIMAVPLARDADGHEMQFVANHLGHFRLARALWPALVRAEGARIVSVSSRGHFYGGIDFDDVDFTARDYDPVAAYAQSKSANALFAIGVDDRGRAEGIRGFSVHPGSIITPLSSHLPIKVIRRYGAVDDEGRPVIDPENDKKTIAQGAATQVWCAVSPQLDEMGGVYCEDCDVAAATSAESDVHRGVKPWAADPALADRLWALSEAWSS
ncbi:NAD(P)-dependent dehydrogenase (short-subunit alcohol dehydrogenase family) [Sphingomonas zeicaulis]|uniref:oxidoreductase n=1 Tax=Sphingomonas zeicaulis TaxID=1632740 RepID=UPI003D1B28D7